jgi:hypothetical protein
MAVAAIGRRPHHAGDRCSTASCDVAANHWIVGAKVPRSGLNPIDGHVGGAHLSRYLDGGALETEASNVAAFRKGLSETGFVDGRNVTIDFRFARTANAPLAELACWEFGWSAGLAPW